MNTEFWPTEPQEYKLFGRLCFI